MASRTIVKVDHKTGEILAKYDQPTMFDPETHRPIPVPEEDEDKNLLIEANPPRAHMFDLKTKLFRPKAAAAAEKPKAASGPANENKAAAPTDEQAGEGEDDAAGK